MSDSSFKYRPVRGGLAEAMSEVKEFESKESLFQYLNTEYMRHILDTESLSLEDMSFEYQCFDDRIGWDSHLVLLKGFPVGYTNKLLGQKEQKEQNSKPNRSFVLNFSSEPTEEEKADIAKRVRERAVAWVNSQRID